MKNILTLFNVANGNVESLAEDSGDPDSVIYDLGAIAEDMNCITALNTFHNKHIQDLAHNVSTFCFSMENTPEEIGTKMINKLNKLTDVSEKNLA